MDNQYLQEVRDEKDLGIMITNDWKSAASMQESQSCIRNDQPYINV